MNDSFWPNLPRPIIALSPMDGVTDAAFRYITDHVGKPAILFTEFTSVEGLARGATRLLSAFTHHTTATPTVAQIFGIEPESFYKAAIIIAEMGFAGIDINMGCPDPHVAKKGGGAGLILQPTLAQRIIIETKRGASEWANGQTVAGAGLPDAIIQAVVHYQHRMEVAPERRLLPVSVKTRIGYDAIVTEPWITTLLAAEPANISLHGRTLKQLYSGSANWEEIGKAARLATSAGIPLLGNGDIHSRAQAFEATQLYGTDGVLLGRVSFGNPWVFTDYEPSLADRIATAINHTKAFQTLTPELHFLGMRKHLAWYCKGFPQASAVRSSLMQATSAADVIAVLGHIPASS